jgi:hypothetical protein
MGVNEGRLGQSLCEPRSQPADVDIHGPVSRLEHPAPHQCVELLAGDNAALAADHHGEHLLLSPGELEHVTPDQNQKLAGADLQVTRPEDLAWGRVSHVVSVPERERPVVTNLCSSSEGLPSIR